MLTIELKTPAISEFGMPSLDLDRCTTEAVK